VASQLSLILLEEIIRIHREEGKPVSTRRLARAFIDDQTDIKRIRQLESRFSYHLKKLADKGLLIPHKERHGTAIWTSYSPNPDRVVCHQGIVFILDSPLTILNCPYVETCPYHDSPSMDKCPLIQNAPPELKEWLSKHLNP